MRLPADKRANVSKSDVSAPQSIRVETRRNDRESQYPDDNVRRLGVQIFFERGKCALGIAALPALVLGAIGYRDDVTIPVLFSVWFAAWFAQYCNE